MFHPNFIKSIPIPYYIISYRSIISAYQNNTFNPTKQRMEIISQTRFFWHANLIFLVSIPHTGIPDHIIYEGDYSGSEKLMEFNGMIDNQWSLTAFMSWHRGSSERRKQWNFCLPITEWVQAAASQRRGRHNHTVHLLGILLIYINHGESSIINIIKGTNITGDNWIVASGCGWEGDRVDGRKDE